MIRVVQVDAFAERPFEGNPAAVCPLDAPIPEALMQAIAAENNLSETAFTVPRPDASYDLRWFTPTVEVDLCGHATLAAGHVLLADAGAVVFHTRSGALSVTRRGDRLVLDLPAQPVGERIDDAAVRAALGRDPLAMWRIKSLHHARYLLAEYATRADIVALTPPRIDGVNVVCTAPGDAVDFVSRFFGWGSGVLEDPVTGSAHCTLTPFWADRLGRATLTARQLSARGGNLWCELAGDRVHVAGHAVTVLVGHLAL